MTNAVVKSSKDKYTSTCVKVQAPNIDDGNKNDNDVLLLRFSAAYVSFTLALAFIRC